MTGPRQLCPKFSNCSAPVCPLDPEWPRARHLPGERVCLWLRELVKEGGEARVAHASTEDLATRVGLVLPDIVASNSDIRSKLRDAARTGTKLNGPRAPATPGAEGAIEVLAHVGATDGAWTAERRRGQP